MSAASTCLWPAERLGEALERLARASGLAPHAVPADDPPAHASRELARLTRWLETRARALGLELEPVQVPYRDVEALLRRAGPALIAIEPGTNGGGYLVLLGARRSRLCVLAPDLAPRELALADALALLCAPIERLYGHDLERLLDETGATGARRARARAALLREQLADAELASCWLLALPPGRALLTQLREQRCVASFAGLVAAQLGSSASLLAAWYALGRGALGGRLEPAWLAAFALWLACSLALRLLATWLQSTLAVRAGGVWKRRLLQGALRIDPELMRPLGAGRLLGRALESEALEALLLGTGFLALGAAIDLPLALFVLARGAAGGVLAALLGACALLALVLAFGYWRASRAWTRARLELTHDLVEQMVGQRTRVAQQTPERMHDGEEQLLERYHERARALDRYALLFQSALPALWLACALLALAPAWIAGGLAPTTLALSLGGVLLAQQALTKWVGALSQGVACAITWRQVRPLYDAASSSGPIGAAALALAPRGRDDERVGGHDDERASARANVRAGVDARSASDAEPDVASAHARDELVLLRGRDLAFRYAGRARPALEACDLALRAGERVLLQGPSGGGKSTLAALLTGRHAPSQGLLLLHGLDRRTWGEAGWRDRVTAAPQFQENHVFNGTLAFNLLMARGWPPSSADLAEAEALCRELGLGELIERMPSRLMTTVGETGWQLSHGERSRLYLARALLQGGEVLVLDESFAALDPDNQRLSIECALRRAQSLVVIAHP